MAGRRAPPARSLGHAPPTRKAARTQSRRDRPPTRDAITAQELRVTTAPRHQQPAGSVTATPGITPGAQRRSLVGPAAFAVISVVLVAVLGVPDQRDVIGLWLVAGLLAFSLADVRGWARGVFRDFVPIFGLLIAYYALRGDAQGLLATHNLPQLRVDEALFGGADQRSASSTPCGTAIPAGTTSRSPAST
jgi:hypothetical protein